MSDYTSVIAKSFRPYLQSLTDDLRSRRDATFFWPNGTQVYCGRQGSGKTTSAVRDVLKLKSRYPQCIIVSNLELKYLRPLRVRSKADLAQIMDWHSQGSVDWAKTYVLFADMPELTLCLVGINNGFKGVVYLIDEIHTYFNALDSKNIPMFVFTEISQQRKQRKVIIGTSQLYLRMAKPFREQCDNLVVCNTYFGFFTTQHAYDGMSLTQDAKGNLQGTVKKAGFFYHNRWIRNAFDTYQKVVSGAEQYADMGATEINIVGKNRKNFSLK